MWTRIRTLSWKLYQQSKSLNVVLIQPVYSVLCKGANIHRIPCFCLGNRWKRRCQNLLLKRFAQIMNMLVMLWVIGVEKRFFTHWFLFLKWYAIGTPAKDIISIESFIIEHLFTLFIGVNLKTGMKGIFPSVYATDLSLLDDPDGDGKRVMKFRLQFLGSVEVGYSKGTEVISQAIHKVCKLSIIT